MARSARLNRWTRTIVALSFLAAAIAAGERPATASAARAPVQDRAQATLGSRSLPSAVTHATLPEIAVDTRTHHVFACDNYSSVDMVDEIRGTPLARISVSGCLGIAVDAATGRAFVFTTAGQTIVLDSRSGREVSAAAGSFGQIIGVLAIGTRLVVAYNVLPSGGFGNYSTLLTHYAGHIVSIDPQTGQVTHDPDMDQNHGAILAADPQTQSVFLLNQHGEIDALDLQTGNRDHLPVDLANIDGLEIVTDGAGGHVFVGRLVYTSTEEPIYIDVYERSTGRLLRTITAASDPDNVSFAMDVDTGLHQLAVLPYFGSNAVYLIDWTTGRQVWAANVISYAGSPVLAIDSQAHRIYFTGAPAPGRDQTTPQGPGYFVSMDERTGRILSVRQVGQYPGAILVDGVAGRAFTATAGVTMMDARATPGIGGAPLPTDPVPPRSGADIYYSRQTQHSLSGPFVRFWQRYGGVQTLGYPQTEIFSDGSHLVQYTDRAEMVLDHGAIRLAPLGGELRTFSVKAPALTGRFLDYWKTHDGAVLLGAPISAVITEGNGDGSGQRYDVQWFERGRLEYHPEAHNPAFQVQLGLVGVQMLRQMGWLPTPPLPRAA